MIMKSVYEYIQEKLIISKTVYKHPEEEYLYHEALKAGYTTKFEYTSNVLQYSIDNCKTWHELEPNIETPKINKGERIYFKGENLEEATYDSGIGIFKSNKPFNAGGNIMSLIYGDDFKDKKELIDNFQFSMLFSENMYLVSCKNLMLPAMALTQECYSHMFADCESLIEAPILLPAIKLNDACYSHMFADCKSLTQAPKLPATELDFECYSSMFDGCKSLTEAPELPATELAYKCYYRMFYCCSLLTVAPKLLASNLSTQCYKGMFAGCSSLNEITMLATDISASECLLMWVYKISRTGIFTKAKDVDIPTDIDANGIPAGWDVKEI